MSQAAPYEPPVLEQPEKPGVSLGRRRTRLLVIPVLIVVLLVAIPGGTYVFAQSQLSQAQSAESAGDYAKALSGYSTVESVAGNPVGKLLLGDLNDQAMNGTAQTHLQWGVQLKQQAKFAESKTQLDAVAQSRITDWSARGNAALADLYVAWGQELVAQQQFQAGIDKYTQVAIYDPAGNVAPSVNAGLAAAYAGFAGWYTTQQPPDYVNALSWYETLIKDYPDGAQAKQAEAGPMPQTLYNAALAFVQQAKYQQARDAMTELVQKYPASSWAPKASTALKAAQPLTGTLVISDQNPTPIANRLIRIAGHWKIVKAHTYEDAAPIYSTVTDAKGNFTLNLPPGQYLITWWDPSRLTFVTTFVSDSVPVNVVTINPLEPAQTTVSSS